MGDGCRDDVDACETSDASLLCDSLDPRWTPRLGAEAQAREWERRGASLVWLTQ